VGWLLSFFLLLDSCCCLLKHCLLLLSTTRLLLALFIYNILLALLSVIMPAYSAPLATLFGDVTSLPLMTLVASYCDYIFAILGCNMESAVVSLCLMLDCLVNFDTVMADVQLGVHLPEANVASGALDFFLHLTTAGGNFYNFFFACFIS
jgi:hypothetical protein